MVMLHDYKKVIAKWLYSGYKLRMLYSLKHFKLVLSFNFQKSYTGFKVQYSIADAGLRLITLYWSDTCMVMWLMLCFVS